jgi:tetratricopeptide (TPR) repeat protein
MNATAERQPVARGNLLETPFCHLALYIYRHAQSGTLIVAGLEPGDATIRFQRGRAAAACLPWAAPRLLDGILPLCGLRAGEFSFFEDDLIGQNPDAVVGIVDPYELLAASLQDNARDDMVDSVLQRFDGKQLRMLPGREIERLRLPDEHKPMLDLIRAAPATSEELIAQAPIPQPQARRLLYALIATNMVAAHDQRDSATFRTPVEGRTSDAPISVPAAGPSGSSSLPSVQPTAAWQRLASLRPGSLGPGSRPPRNSAQPASAQSHVSLRPSSIAPEGDDKPSRIKRAEQLLQRSRYDEALASVDAMLAGEPYDAELLALRALTLFERHQINPDGLPRSVLEAIRRALEADPEHPRALFTKGLVFKRAGDPRKAAVYFRKVLQVDPKHIEAQRELRLAKLRE